MVTLHGSLLNFRNSSWPTIQGAEDTLLTLTADIVAAHVSNNSVAVNDLPNLIQNVHGFVRHFADICRSRGQAGAQDVDPLVGETGLYRLPRMREAPEDAEATSDDQPPMTPDNYRQKWGLSSDYPMVAPNYAEQRRALAKSIGLGTKRKRAASDAKCVILNSFRINLNECGARLRSGR